MQTERAELKSKRAALRLPAWASITALGGLGVGALLTACGGGAEERSAIDEAFGQDPKATERLLQLPTAEPTLSVSANEPPIIYNDEFAEVGERVPDLRLPDINGNQISLRDFEGPLIVQFRVRNCNECDHHTHLLENIQREIFSSELSILTVYTQLESTVDNSESWPAVFDLNRKVSEQFFFGDYPATVFIDGNQMIQDIHVDNWEYRSLRAVAEKLASGEDIVPERDLFLNKSLLGLPTNDDFTVFTRLILNENELANFPNLTAEDRNYFLSLQGTIPSVDEVGEIAKTEAELEFAGLIGQRIAQAVCIDTSDRATLGLLASVATRATEIFQKYTFQRVFDINDWPAYAANFNPDCEIVYIPTEN